MVLHGTMVAPDYLSTLNRDLDILNSVEIGAFISDTAEWAYPTVMENGSFYFLSPAYTDKERIAPYKYRILKFTVEGLKLELFCELEREAKTISLHDNRIFAYTLRKSESADSFNHFIEIYDCSSAKRQHSLSVDYSPAHGEFMGDRLYVNGFDCLVKYRLEGNDLIEEARTALNTSGSDDDPSFHYINGIFCRS